MLVVPIKPCKPREHKEPCQQEVEEMVAYAEPPLHSLVGATKEDEDQTIADFVTDQPPLQEFIGKTKESMAGVRAGYAEDNLFKKVVTNLPHHRMFWMEDNILYTKNPSG